MVELPCETPIPGEIEFECCVLLRKVIPIQLEANLVCEKDKCEEIIGPPVCIIASEIVFKESKCCCTKQRIKVFGIPKSAVIVACHPLNVVKHIEMIGNDNPHCLANVKVTVCFDAVVIFSAVVEGKTRIVSRQFCNLSCHCYFCVPEPKEGTLVAKVKIRTKTPVCWI
ncbi:hypothetical protein H1S01_04290 [Heliobacterium chlorum]|uniref:SipL SPOCS domain-containing protein n=1 Tax=Heliobacterium chlorum TaxID=2698 RepID=A0ABR7T258_HELCL|nr:hypothetical protein [Heliobacterium chlorum]MBC9783731.1 hypothetical protein [Heliobacterium chlorum]